MSNPLGLDQQAFESNVAFAMTVNGLGTDQSPLGMDLGEFMMEGDLEFLNHFSMSNGGVDHRISMNETT